jgi:hypothetical protein
MGKKEEKKKKLVGLRLDNVPPHSNIEAMPIDDFQPSDGGE